MSARKLKLFRTLIIIGAAAAVVCGIFLGEAQDAYQKAIRICMECIGLG